MIFIGLLLAGSLIYLAIALRRAPEGCEICLGFISCRQCSIQGTPLCPIVNGGAS
jgi:hypothetical protein